MSSYNYIVGEQSGNVSSLGIKNTLIGYGMPTVNSSSNTVVGALSFHSGTINANNNVVVGNESFKVVSTGDDNVTIGSGSMPALTTGSQNVCVGSTTGQVLTTGHNNTFIGYGVQDTITTGDYNTCIGYDSKAVAFAGASLGADNQDAICINNVGASENGLIMIGNENNAKICVGGITSTASASTISGIQVAGSVYQLTLTSSTSKIKDIIGDLEKDDVIDKLKVVQFYSKCEADKKRHQLFTGLIAEDVYKIDNNLVNLNTNGEPASLDWACITSHLIKKVQELNDKINKLELFLNKS